MFHVQPWSNGGKVTTKCPDSDDMLSKRIGGVASVLDYEKLLRVGLVDQRKTQESRRDAVGSRSI